MLGNSVCIDRGIYEAECEEYLDRLPKCDVCHEPIQDDDYIELPDGTKLCNECEEENIKDLWYEWARSEYVVVNEGY